MARKKKFLCPSYIELFEPVFKALGVLGGSGSNDEICEAVIGMLNLPDNIVDEPHKGGSGQGTELEYQLAWARTYLKKFGAITNSSRGIWRITPEFSNLKEIDGKAVARVFSDQKRNENKKEQITPENFDENEIKNGDIEIPEELEPWRNELAEILHSMSPYAFERLTQLLLRACGFTQVNVTKKSGDGGIDGTGKMNVNGLLSFSVAFQCKRYSGSIAAGDIRDFRGSLTTDIEKGVFITTGTFTRAAKEEASIAGKQQIDLMDGEELINKLLECRLGVRERIVFEVDKDFFEKV